MDKELWKLLVHSDDSFATNIYKNSELGYVVFLASKNKKFRPLYWTPHKS